MALDIEAGVNGSQDPEAADRGERAALADDLRAIGGLTRDLGRDAAGVAREWIEPNPYAALIVAVGVGYVLGGGLPHVLVRRVLSLGGRIAFDLTLTRVLAGAAGAIRGAAPR